MLKEEDYRKFLDYVQKEDDKLYELSTKFATLSGEAKRILDDLKEKSAKRQADFAVEGGTHDNRNDNHHRVLPRDVKEKLLDTAKEVDNLHLTFDKFTLQTQSAVLSLHESQERVQAMRKDASIVGNDNMFEKMKEN